MPAQKTALAASVPSSPPLAPEDAQSPLAAGKRRRLAKAFDRPLDKKLRAPDRVRVKVSLRSEDYAALVGLQRRLADAGVSVKKSALLRSGLRLLATYDDAAFRQALTRLPAAD